MTTEPQQRWTASGDWIFESGRTVAKVAFSHPQACENRELIARAPELLAMVAELEQSHKAMFDAVEGSNREMGRLNRDNARLRERVEQLDRMCTIDGIEDLIKQNARLRELLRECREYVPVDLQAFIDAIK